MDQDNRIKRGRAMRWLVADVDAHVRLFGPMPLRIVTAKYFRTLERLGGFHDALEELKADGTLTVIRNRTGSVDLTTRLTPTNQTDIRY